MTPSHSEMQISAREERRDRVRRLEVTPRDRAILERALRKLGPSSVDFGDALRALRESVEELIPDGRIYLLGTCDEGVIVGSIISGIGIAPSEHAIRVLRVGKDGRHRTIGRLRP